MIKEAMIIAVSERDKPVDAASKPRAGTKRAGYSMKVDRMNEAIAMAIDNPIPKTSNYGSRQVIRSWRHFDNEWRNA